MAENGEYPKRLYSSVMQRYFWVDETKVEPINNEACYCFEEIKLIAATFPKLTTETLKSIYDIKVSIGAKLTDLSPYIETVVKAAPSNIIEETIEMLKKAVVKSHTKEPNVKHL